MRLSSATVFLAGLLAVVAAACSSTTGSAPAEITAGNPDEALPEESADDGTGGQGGRRDASSSNPSSPTPPTPPTPPPPGTLSCGACVGALTCGGGGIANKCGRPSFVFTTIASGTTAALTGVSGSSINDIWAVGESGLAMHWNGAAWTQHPTGTIHNRAVSVTAGRTLVVGPPGRVLQRTGTAWSPLVAESDGADFISVWDSGNDLWAVGWHLRGPQDGHIVHVASGAADTTWSDELMSVWGTSPSNVWVGGYQGRLGHWNGAAWSWEQLPATTNTIVGIWGGGADDVWAVTPNGVVGRFNGTSWTRGGGSNGLWAVHGTSASDVWRVGSAGLIEHFDGSTWTSVASGTTAHLSSVWATPSEVWIVGFGGTVLRGRLVGSDACWPNTACTAPHRNACKMQDGVPSCACTAGFHEVGGACVPVPAVCTPACAGKQCGPDGCGGSCGLCAGGNACLASGQCACVPQCAGKTCGGNGCGGSCGTCGAAEMCNASSQCVLPPCDPVANVGCALPNQCITLANQSNLCVLMGTGVQGSPCVDSASCKGGHGCFAGTCRKICDRLTGDGCAFDESCAGVVGWSKYGVCAK